LLVVRDLVLLPRITSLLRSVFVRFERIEGATPAIREIERRHIQDKHRVMPSPVTAPLAGEFAAWAFTSWFPPSKKLESAAI
jgi:hypothetical protein